VRPDPGKSADNGAVGAGPGAVPDPAGAPTLSVLKGRPTAEEIAALVVVLATRTAPATAQAVPQRPRSQWSARSWLLREPVRHGPGGWRASALPR
jgi:hypothetical protein